MGEQIKSALEVFGQQLANDKQILNMIADFIKKELS